MIGDVPGSVGPRREGQMASEVPRRSGRTKRNGTVEARRPWPGSEKQGAQAQGRAASKRDRAPTADRSTSPTCPVAVRAGARCKTRGGAAGFTLRQRCRPGSLFERLGWSQEAESSAPYHRGGSSGRDRAVTPAPRSRSFNPGRCYHADTRNRVCPRPSPESSMQS
jgi:hypothetical protein